MKKILSLVMILVLILVFALSGCSSATPTQSTTGDAEKSAFVSDASDEYYMVTFLSGYPFWKDCYAGFEDAAALYGAKTLYGGTTEYDINQAVTALEQIIAKKPAGIAVTCMDADAYIEPINKAIAAGIPIVVFDSDSPKSDRLVFIGTENFAAGATAAKFIGEKMDGKGKVAAVTSLGQSNIAERTKGFEETIKADFPGIELVQIVDGGTDEVSAATNVANLLTANPDIDYLFCALVSAMTGSQTALAEKGLADKIKIVGMDTDDITLEGIQNGTVEATISQAPWCEGFWAMNYLYYMANGLIDPTGNGDWLEKGYPSIPVKANSGSTVVTKDNLAMFVKSK